MYHGTDNYLLSAAFNINDHAIVLTMTEGLTIIQVVQNSAAIALMKHMAILCTP